MRSAKRVREYLYDLIRSIGSRHRRPTEVVLGLCKLVKAGCTHGIGYELMAICY